MLSRRKRIVTAIALILCIFYFFSYTLLGSTSNQRFQGLNLTSGNVHGAGNKINEKINDLTIFFEGLEEYHPGVDSIKDKYKTEKAKEAFYGGDFLFSKEYLENVLDISEATFNALKNSHSKFVSTFLPNILNENIATFGRNLPTDADWEQYKNSKGYVLIGGGKYSWLAYLVIKQLRATGAKLPIELFIPGKSEYESNFCEKILPKYNARCNVFDEDLANDLKDKFGIGGYQYKMLALISSKFENVLYLDSDGFPTKNLDYLFESELYRENNLIIWPDAWARTTNPKFYDIAGHKVTNEKIRYSDRDTKQENYPNIQFDFTNSNFHDFKGTIPDPSSETGILMINKTSHLKTLLLCLYYNVYGPQFYYPLLTQGSAGEGDKETFIAAAVVMNEPWFQTLKQFTWVGYFKEEGDFTAKALGHFDPVQTVNMKEGDKVDYCFMHLSYPKFYPNWLVDNKDLISNSGKHIRMYASVNENVGYDFDYRVLQFFVQGLCPNYYGDDGVSKDGTGILKENEFVGDDLNYLKDDSVINFSRCEEVFIPHLKWLKETTDYSDTNSF